MTLEQFVRQFADAIQTDPGSLRPDVRLADLAEFDSMGRLCVMSMIDSRFGYVIPADVLNKMTTIGELFHCAQRGSTEV